MKRVTQLPSPYFSALDPRKPEERLVVCMHAKTVPEMSSLLCAACHSQCADSHSTRTDSRVRLLHFCMGRRGSSVSGHAQNGRAGCQAETTVIPGQIYALVTQEHLPTPRADGGVWALTSDCAQLPCV